MKLYAITIYGHKFYFTGELRPETTTAVEHFCRQLESDMNETAPQKPFAFLLNYIKSTYNCPVTPINIEHIFRINF